MNANPTPKERATALALQVLQAQPNLIESHVATAANGKDVGDFIVALRDRLTALYERQP